jgi:S-(hydroxymethyl)glutathione dehydrogenase/alcohol dehydrogenase
MPKGHFKAAVLRNIGEPLSIETVHYDSLGFGQVLVKMIYSGVCRSQLMEIAGLRGEDKWLPHLLGHEGLGSVEAIGPGVTKVNEGDKVVLSWLVSDGVEAETESLKDEHGNYVNYGKVTTFSEYSLVSENRLIKAPQGFSDRLLPLFGCALLTGGGMALEFASSKKVQSICILGFGGIGSAAALVARGLGHNQICIVDSSSEKRELARSLGFDQTADTTELNEEAFDLVIEATGSIEGIERGFELLSRSGTLVFASHPENGRKISIDPHELIKGKKIFGTWGGNLNPREGIEEISRILLSDQKNLELLCGEEFMFGEINSAIDFMKADKPGRPLIRFKEQ